MAIIIIIFIEWHHFLFFSRYFKQHSLHYSGFHLLAQFWMKIFYFVLHSFFNFLLPFFYLPFIIIWSINRAYLVINLLFFQLFFFKGFLEVSAFNYYSLQYFSMKLIVVVYQAIMSNFIIFNFIIKWFSYCLALIIEPFIN